MRVTGVGAGGGATLFQTASSISFPVDADRRVFDVEFRLQFMLDLFDHTADIDPVHRLHLECRQHAT